MRLFKYICIFLTGIAIAVIFYGGVNYMAKVREAKKGEEQRKALYGQILSAASVAPLQFNIDYSKPVAKGSPLVFGGSHYPPLENKKAWDAVQDVGVTSIRVDLSINWMIRNTTLDDYKNNKNNIQNIENWNKTDLNKIKNILIEAKKRGMKTIAILDYAPPWLTYNQSDFGVPMDWNIYEDIVKKIYSFNREYIDYLEIWNEANHKEFLTLDNSNMSRSEAYKNIFLHAAKAIREVDNQINDSKRVPIGGPVDPSPNDPTLLEAILSNNETTDYLDFASYHNYDYVKSANETYSSTLEKYGKKDVPIFITEWNYNGQSKINEPQKTSTLSIPYTGEMLLNFLSSGIKASNYFSLQPVRNNWYLGFYQIENSNIKPLPQMGVWKLMSRKLSLGAGESTIYFTGSGRAQLKTIGFKNINNEIGAITVNPNPMPEMISIEFSNTSLGDFAEVEIYEVSENNNSERPIYEGLIKSQSGIYKITYISPRESIVGLKLKTKNDWFDVLTLPLNVVNK